ncbi:hypothetical protein [Brassicibacter mesophilus]|uniref:hypothetical protein n=1 Tax=Brassicibacter mesophilus TaxID=745119 RepID=UPI003D1D0BA6
MEGQLESKANYNDFSKSFIDARFYVDSILITINRVEHDYDKAEINQERRAGRYGKLY